MAVGIENYVNIDTSEPGKYPAGAIKDNDGSNNGTPVDRATYNDIHQLLFVLLFQAGITPSGIPENAVDGYQYLQALKAYILAQHASEALRGVAQIATQAETNAGTDDFKFITPLKLQTRAATEILKGIAELATQAEADAGSDDERIVTPLKLNSFVNTKIPLRVDIMHTAGGIYLNTKVVKIGDWNMDTTAAVTVAHGVTNSKIRSVSAMIRNDADSNYNLLSFVDASTVAAQGGIGAYNAGNISLVRLTGGAFDSASFAATGYNRGWITIVYES